MPITFFTSLIPYGFPSQLQCDEGCFFFWNLILWQKPYPKVIVDCKKVLGTIAEIILLMYFCITDSLRLLQHVETILVPSSWESIISKTREEISWEEKQFKVWISKSLTRFRALSCYKLLIFSWLFYFELKAGWSRDDHRINSGEHVYSLLLALSIKVYLSVQLLNVQWYRDR